METKKKNKKEKKKKKAFPMDSNGIDEMMICGI